MGVITYFLLCGYTPFDRDTQQQEMAAIIAGDFKFEPAEYWTNVSTTARDFVSECLTIDPASRPTAVEMLKHKWLSSERPHFVLSSSGGPTDLLPHVKKHFDAKKTCTFLHALGFRCVLIVCSIVESGQSGKPFSVCLP
jgi:calcium/calmodulin-dependent protein kinase I